MCLPFNVSMFLHHLTCMNPLYTRWKCGAISFVSPRIDVDILISSYYIHGSIYIRPGLEGEGVRWLHQLHICVKVANYKVVGIELGHFSTCRAVQRSKGVWGVSMRCLWRLKFGCECEVWVHVTHLMSWSKCLVSRRRCADDRFLSNPLVRATLQLQIHYVKLWLSICTCRV